METQSGIAEVAARVRNVIAAYAQALDDGRVDDLVATFCPDGWCDMPGLGRHTGRDAIREAFATYQPGRPQRHLVLNTHLTDWQENEVHATSDVVFLLKGESGWAVRLVGRYEDVLHRDGTAWLFHSRVADFA